MTKWMGYALAVGPLAAIVAGPALSKTGAKTDNQIMAEIDSLARGAPAPARSFDAAPSHIADRPLPSANAPAPSRAPMALPSVPVVMGGATGRIVMYRPGAITGMALGCPIRFQGREIVELGRNKFAEWTVPAGSYILTNKTSSVEVNVLPGQVKFIRCSMKPGFMTGRADLQIVDQQTFAQHYSDYERKDVAATGFAIYR